MGGHAARSAVQVPDAATMAAVAAEHEAKSAMAMGDVAAAAATIMVHFILLGWFGVGVAGTNTLFAMCT